MKMRFLNQWFQTICNDDDPNGQQQQQGQAGSTVDGATGGSGSNRPPVVIIEDPDDSSNLSQVSQFYFCSRCYQFQYTIRTVPMNILLNLY